ncbi:MAG: glycosyltransferase family 4 protein [Candidatus Fervidibacter sp.]|uniref:glycosyltransferase family 4 protein n=1 Tax=Candidatus Fervidibacter sp. TaxID=3100871 RepID=UPI004049CCF5
MVEQVRHLRKFCDITVLVPHPWVPPLLGKFSAKWRRYAQLPSEEVITGVRVLHPRRIIIPKVNSWSWMTFSVTLSYWHFFRLTHFPISDLDLIEGHFALPDGFAAAWLGRKFGKPSLVHVCGTDVHTIPNESPLLRRLVAWALRNANGVRAISQALANGAIALGADAAKVRVIYNGVDVQRFTLMPREIARQQLGIDPQRRYLLYVGRLVAVKGLDLLLDAAAIVMRQQADTELVLVGDGSERTALQQRAERLGIASRTHFVGVQPHDRIPLWMNAGDVLCLLSLKEGMSNVSLEALSCGTPVVATAVGGIPEIVEDGEVGYLVRSRDPEELATCLLQALYRDWDRAALRKYAMRFSYETIAQQLLELYRGVTRNASRTDV